ncbi:uncharacterized protein BO95DRAFT_437845 [Aspergillus brunneoviolaceus CBS 621.78]|uniref:Uncharacterized protein n=1 Tax=Aspergillus brunneoviolaceus CBS 621.78 TaxID=1450534 RepID=A0ACD1GP61_9EURO|nr:hypothetical protein BO95DRAFT_437845 [Aspergillus brunneoviolaceus CBS 621.78]RAH51035.1 hypothetical protein BO95DRAFT_437845 [Aspergillus brunneoviolaceus CBS 621.78]
MAYEVASLSSTPISSQHHFTDPNSNNNNSTHNPHNHTTYLLRSHPSPLTPPAPTNPPTKAPLILYTTQRN